MKEELNAKREVWLSHVREWQSSGKTQSEYCREHNLPEKSFWYYKKKYFSKEDRLVEIKINRQSDRAFVELVSPDGMLLRFREGIHSSNLRNIITALRG